MTDNNQPGQATPPSAGNGPIKSPPPQPSLEEKKEAARQAMEGAEWTAKRESETKAKETQAELAKINAQLNTLRAEKEKLELAWIELDDSRKQLRKVLDPILAEEKKAEEEEANLEAEEAKIGIAGEKQQVEKKRWSIQDRRKEIEQRKWIEEDKLTKIEQILNDNTAKYRQLLDEEDKLDNQVEKLKAESGV